MSLRLGRGNMTTHRRRGRVRVGGSPPPPPKRVEVPGVGRYAERVNHGGRRTPDTPLNDNARALLALLSDAWQPTVLLAGDAGLTPAQASAGLRELAIAGLAESRAMSAARFPKKEYRLA